LRQLGWSETSTIEVLLTKAVTVHQPTNGEMQFLAKLKSCFAHVKSYSDGSLQQTARGHVPEAELKRRALETISKCPSVSLGDAMLLELLHWFKKDFFKWVNKPECGKCEGKEATMKGIGATMPNAEERLGAAGVTEIYVCQLCGCQTRFPRYNDPGKLLTWRQGRCGEFANCFTLFCLSLGFEARHVVDWTDHVWTEVWSDSQQRWLHCDSCEDKCDIPLIYEAGWGKKLNYAIAFAQTHIIDVTKRYTRQWDEVLTRRNLINETFLEQQINNFNQLIASNLPPEYLPTLIERNSLERQELEHPISTNPQGLEGRISGSHDWKLARGETGPSSS
jgi:peptide-N4-(N-acetyl-beta-glucosaminyl)asparagine amidase